jgi:spermidine synthase
MGTRFGTATAIFTGGGVAVIAQTIAVREAIVVFAGSEVSLAVLFAAWFAGIALGASAAPSFLRAANDARDVVALVVALLAFAPLAAIVVARGLPTGLGLPAGEIAPLSAMALGTALVALPGGALVGAFYPTAVAAWNEERGASGALGLVYGIEAAGSLAGGLAFTFLLLPVATPVTQATVAAGVGLFGAALAARRGWNRRLAVIALGVVAVAAPADGPAAVERITAAARARAQVPGVPFVGAIETPMQSLSVYRGHGQFDVFADGQPAISFPDDHGNGRETALVLVQHPSPTRVLVLGGEAEDLARHLRDSGVSAATFVDPDAAAHAAMLALAPEATRRAFDGGGAVFVPEDGRAFVRRGRGGFDLIWVRVPDPATLAGNRYFTKEFYEAARGRLAPGGVLATSIPGSANYAGPELLAVAASLRATLRAAFGHVLSVPGDRAMFFASDDPAALVADPARAAERWTRRRTTLATFRPELFHSWLDAGRIASWSAELDGVAAAVNSDARPGMYFHHLLRRERLANGSGDAFVAAGRNVGRVVRAGLVALGVLYAVVLARVALGRVTPRAARFSGSLVVFASGTAGFALALVVLLAYQNRFGSLYERVGALTAMFMAGAAAGAIAHVGWSGRRPVRLVAAAEAALIVLAALVAGTTRRAEVPEAAFAVLNVAVGGVLGFLFSAVGRWIAENGDAQPAAIAARLDRADHLGAAIGALATGVLLVPAFGIAGTCLAIVAGTGSTLLVFVVVAARLGAVSNSA